MPHILSQLLHKASLYQCKLPPPVWTRKYKFQIIQTKSSATFTIVKFFEVEFIQTHISHTHMITKSVSSTINLTNKLLGNFLYSYSRESVIIMCVCLDLWLLVQEYVTTTRQIAIRASHIIAWARPSSSPSAISIAS